MSSNNQQASQPLKIFFFAKEVVGPINACIGMAQALAGRGHRIYFLGGDGQFAKYGFEEVPLHNSSKQGTPATDKNAQANENPVKAIAEKLIKGSFLSPKTPLEKMRAQLAANVEIFGDILAAMPEYNVQMAAAIERERPDAFILDSFVLPPAIPQAKLPWMILASGQPLCVFGSKGSLPPFGAGFPVDSDPASWVEHAQVWEQYRYEIYGGKYQTELDRQFAFSPPAELHDGVSLYPTSPYLNIYGYPEELDYSDVYRVPDNFARVDAFVREVPEPFVLPSEIAQMPGNGKLCYLSLGSMGAIDVGLMRRILSVLAKTPYKYIVSKGPRAAEYELPANCWGEAFLPQTRILPLVDLVITHGGNNTVTETFSCGKPMIVMPLFGDQFDNGQRVAEKSFGVCLLPYHFKDEELIGALDKLLNDTELHKRLEAASKRMQNSNSKQKVCQQIEQVVAKYKAEH